MSNPQSEFFSEMRYIASRCIASRRSTLAELEALAGLLLPVLLALYHARITRHVPVAAKRRLEGFVDLDKTACDAMTDSAGLACVATTVHVGVNIETVNHLDRHQR